MKKQFTVLIVFAIVLSLFVSCGSPKGSDVSENNLDYMDTKWGMTVDEIIDLKGEPDSRNDEYTSDGGESEDSDDSDEGNAEDVKKLKDFYYDNKELFDKFPIMECYQFDKDDRLEGVIAEVNVGSISEDLTNLEDVRENARTMYMDIRGILTELHGEPAAEYTAYRDGSDYKTEEVLDLNRENSVVHASRWDGDNYRFIYILFYAEQVMLEVRYIPHDEATVNKVNEENAN